MGDEVRPDIYGSTIFLYSINAFVWSFQKATEKTFPKNIGHL